MAKVHQISTAHVLASRECCTAAHQHNAACKLAVMLPVQQCSRMLLTCRCYYPATKTCFVHMAQHIRNLSSEQLEELVMLGAAPAPVILEAENLMLSTAAWHWSCFPTEHLAAKAQCSSIVQLLWKGSSTLGYSTLLDRRSTVAWCNPLRGAS